ncbi:hypothetical protein F5144DRAFT_472050, partial [Chaetomium tenue]
PAPPTPYPWIWRCHECDSEYPLAATRRCLYCSHHFCTAPPADTSLRRRIPGRRDCCDAEFDYYGWARWGAYRRSRKRSCDIGAADQDTFAKFGLTTGRSRRSGPDTGGLLWKPLSRSAVREVARGKRRMYVSGQYNCGLHCDFPTECVRNIYSAWTAR